VVEERTRIGDWEGDLIVGRFNRSAIGTLVDRRTGYLRLVHLPDGHSAERLRWRCCRSSPTCPTSPGRP
jgi:IS30 family transposase